MQHCGDLLTLGCGFTDPSGHKELPIICLTELSPCSCMNNDSLVPSSVQMDQEEEVVDGGGEPEEESQSLLKDYNASLYN